MIIMVCVCCKKVMGTVNDDLNADSGDICPKCMNQQYHDAYLHMKAKGFFSSEQIAEAESIVIQGSG